MHNHTSFSTDGLMSPRSLLVAAQAKGLGCIAVTDHNTVKGGVRALELADADPSLPRVIPGIELMTEVGEVVGLYVREEIPARIPLTEAVERIRELGGLVYLPHPFDVFRRGAIEPTEREKAAQLADLIEVVNGRALGPRAGIRSSQLAGRYAKPGGAGSDAHREREVGRAYVVVGRTPTRDDLVELVARGRVEHSLGAWEYGTNWFMQASSPMTRAWRKIKGNLPEE